MPKPVNQGLSIKPRHSNVRARSTRASDVIANGRGKIHTRARPTEENNMKAHRPTIMGTRHMVAACQYLAAEAGFRILEAGGNAIDAGVAGGIALGVVQPEYVNFAGVAPIIIHLPDRSQVVTISGLGTWPKGHGDCLSG